MLSVTLGSAIGPFAGIFLANNFGYPVVFIVASVLVAASIPAALLLRPAPSTRVRGNEQEAEAEMASASDAVAGTVADAPLEQAREDAAAVTDNTRAACAAAAVSADDAPCPVCADADADCPACGRVPSTHLEEVVAAKVEGSPLARFVEAGVLPISVVCGLLFFG